MREPMKDYLRSSVEPDQGSTPGRFPAFKQRADGTGDAGADFDLDEPRREELDALLEHAFERYFETSGLFGTPDDVPRDGRAAAAASASTRSPA